MAESIYKSVKPFYYFAKLTGFACFTIKGKATDGKIKTTIFDILLLIAFMLIPNLNVINDIYNLNRFLRIRHVMIYFYNVGSSLFVLQSFNQRLDLWNILRNIHEFDTGIQALGYSVNHKKHQRFVWIYILCTILLIIITLCLIMSRRTFEARTLLVYLSAIIIFIQFGSFQLSLVIANSKLNDFNMYLENIFLFRKKGFKHLRNKELGTHVIKTVKLYQILDDIISSINQSFSLVCLICFSLYFMFVILIVFSIFRVIYSDQNVLTPILLTTYSYIFLFYFLYVIGILIAANGITGKGRHTLNIVYRAIHLSMDVDVQENLYRFALQIGSKIPIISCGLFTVDWRLFYTMLAAAATYLVILIQFDSGRRYVPNCFCNCTLYD